MQNQVGLRWDKLALVTDGWRFWREETEVTISAKMITNRTFFVFN